MSQLTELIQQGIAKKLGERGVQSPELVASQIMAKAKVDGNALTIEGQSVDNYLDAFFKSSTDADAGGEQKDEWVAPSVERCLQDVNCFEDWLEHDRAGCERAFAAHMDGIEENLGLSK